MLGKDSAPVPAERRREASLGELVLTVSQELGWSITTGGQEAGHQAAHPSHPANQDLSYSSAVELELELEVTMETKHLQYCFLQHW